MVFYETVKNDEILKTPYYTNNAAFIDLLNKTIIVLLMKNYSL